MAEYIERKKLNDYLDTPFTMSMGFLSTDVCKGANKAREIFKRIFNELPAADVAPVRHGRWLSKEYMYGDPDVGVPDTWVERLAEQSDYYAYCSVCRKDAEYNAEGSLILSDYCPNCGAKMDKDGDA